MIALLTKTNINNDIENHYWSFHEVQRVIVIEENQ
jgi:hypothetical protein